MQCSEGNPLYIYIYFGLQGNPARSLGRGGEPVDGTGAGTEEQHGAAAAAGRSRPSRLASLLAALHDLGAAKRRHSRPQGESRKTVSFELAKERNFEWTKSNWIKSMSRCNEVQLVHLGLRRSTRTRPSTDSFLSKLLDNN